jgi:small GTP-binding protein
MTKNSDIYGSIYDGVAGKNAPPGTKLFRTIIGHNETILCLNYSPCGKMIASGSRDFTIKVWDADSGDLIFKLPGHTGFINCLAFGGNGILVSGSSDGTIKIWSTKDGNIIHTINAHQNAWVNCIFLDNEKETIATGGTDETIKLWSLKTNSLIGSFIGNGNWVTGIAGSHDGSILAGGYSNGMIKIWNKDTGSLIRNIEAHSAGTTRLAFDQRGAMLASGSWDTTIKLWDSRSGKLIRTLEGHTEPVDYISFSANGSLFASKSRDHTIRIWNCSNWDLIAVIPAPTVTSSSNTALAFHPSLPLLAFAGSITGADDQERGRVIRIWKLDYKTLLGDFGENIAARSIRHTTSKVVVVGDHSVGKSALIYRIINGIFKEQSSTHGQQFWVLPALGKKREDGTECEAIVWDFAGQPDYRLVHALFLDNADLALILFDASDLRDPLHGVGFWLKQLQKETSSCKILLVASQIDRGTCPLTSDELTAFCVRHSVAGPVMTSSYSGEGVHDLIDMMKSMIPWDDKAATVTTENFKRIKDYVLGLKADANKTNIIVTLPELRANLLATDAQWEFTDSEMLTAMGHLENYGYLKRLRTSNGEQRILLQPERLNNLASSFVLEARRNPKGLGALEEKRLLKGEYDFHELADLRDSDREILLDSAALLFIENNVCFREIDPLRMEPYLLFPELINLKHSIETEIETEDSVSYTVCGPTENVFSSLVVLLGYTHTFTRTSQWNNNARYEVGKNISCGFRQEAERDGELDFVLCFSRNAVDSVKILFQGIFESFLARKNLTVTKSYPVKCGNSSCNQLLDRAVIKQRIKDSKYFSFCNECGERITIPNTSEVIQLNLEIKAEVNSQRRIAEQRTRFEQSLFQIQAYVTEQNIFIPKCFISYAWGNQEHETWVEKRLASDIQKAGVEVILDRWHNYHIGSSVSRFVERVIECDFVIVVGTPTYRTKYHNNDPMRSYVVAAEGDLIGKRLIGSEEDKSRILPILRAGTDETSFPDLLLGRVYADFRDEHSYFSSAFDIILSLFRLAPNQKAVADLRESLKNLQ